jgi:cell division transport system permease protein
MRNLIYFLKEAFRGLYQAKLMTFVSICTIGVSLLFLCIVIAGFLTIQEWLGEASRGVQVVAFLADSSAADTAASRKIVEDARSRPFVRSAVFIDKKAAWDRFSQAYGAQLIEAVDKNPLPASLEISLREAYQSPDSIDNCLKAITSLTGVEGISYSRDWVMQLQKIKRYFIIGGLIVLITVALALNFMISNSIKLTIYARKELVTNMRLVGATNSYIRMPFIFEGMLQGLIGAVLALAIIFSGKFALSHLPIVWGSGSFLSTLIISLGLLVGCIGSTSAIRKFLS